MNEPIYHIPSHEGMRIYRGGEFIGTTPHAQVPGLLVKVTEQIVNRPEKWRDDEPVPASLASNLRAAHALAAAMEGPHKTIITTALTQAIQALGEAP